MIDWLLSLLPSGEMVGNAMWVLGTFLILLLVVPLSALGLPGSWLALLWCGASYFCGVESVSLWWLGGAVAVAAAGELVEQVLGIAATKKGGGGKSGMWGAAIGSLVAGIVGMFVPPPVIGAILVAMVGAFLGAFVGETWFAARSSKEAMRPALWAAGGRLAGLFAKILSSGIVAMLIAIDLGLDLIWPE